MTFVSADLVLTGLVLLPLGTDGRWEFSVRREPAPVPFPPVFGVTSISHGLSTVGA